MDDDKYPHWKDALFGNNDAVANIRCAIHYVFWHTVYGLIAIGGLFVAACVKFGLTIAPYLGPIGDPLVRTLNYVGSRILYVMNHRYTQKVFDYLVIVLAAVVVGGGIAGIIFIAITDTVLFLAYVGALVGVVILTITMLFIASYIEDPARDAAIGAANKARETGEKATQIPGIRRVYGECPVDIVNQSPKWFDDLFDGEDEF